MRRKGIEKKRKETVNPPDPLRTRKIISLQQAEAIQVLIHLQTEMKVCTLFHKQGFHNILHIGESLQYLLRYHASIFFHPLDEND